MSATAITRSIIELCSAPSKALPLRSARAPCARPSGLDGACAQLVGWQLRDGRCSRRRTVQTVQPGLDARPRGSYIERVSSSVPPGTSSRSDHPTATPATSVAPGPRSKPIPRTDSRSRFGVALSAAPTRNTAARRAIALRACRTRPHRRSFTSVGAKRLATSRDRRRRVRVARIDSVRRPRGTRLPVFDVGTRPHPRSTSRALSPCQRA